MKVKRLRGAVFALAIVLALFAGPVWAHHSFAATYLEDQTQKIDGKIVQFLLHNPHSYPAIDIKNGGSIQGLINALNTILDKTVYKHEEEGGTLIVPGHGRICDATGPWTTDMFVAAVYAGLKQGRPKAEVSQ